VPALVLVGAAGLGREVNPGMKRMALPGLGEWATARAGTRPGRALRLWWRPRALFAYRRRVPAGWIADQDRLSRRPDFLWNSLEVLRAVIDRPGQREVLRDRLPELAMPTLIVWGERDRVVPLAQARDAVGRLRRGRLVVIPDCGHLPQIERPELFLEALGSFLDGPSAGAESGGNHAG
jgi:pimeloyl-ACP methyl ester carboxylesterase